MATLCNYTTFMSERAASLCCLLSLTLLGILTRVYNIDIPNHICWDEIHFGRIVNNYLSRENFYDVHPPLGKMLIVTFGYISGYNGSFAYANLDDVFDSPDQYVGMRIGCALFGAGVVPLSYLCVRELGQSIMAATLASTLILLDTGITTLSRFILLDPILMFFITLSTFFLLKFVNLRNRPFCVQWWLWMCLTGIALSCTIGVKFVGLFVILLAGLTTVWDLWSLIDESSLSVSKVIQHLMARTLGFVALPIIIYCSFFAIHLAITNRAGRADGAFSSAFQSQLIGNKLHNATMPHNMAYGSVVTIKQVRSFGGYLHSHNHNYNIDHAPKLQQVTRHTDHDENNYWRVRRHNSTTVSVDSLLPVHLIRTGDMLCLEHVTTSQNLHSHHEHAPISNRQYQVAGHLLPLGECDENDVWVITVPGEPPGKIIESMVTQFHLVHHKVGCALCSDAKKLPSWGYEQYEVACNPLINTPNSLWHIEEVIDRRLPNVNLLFNPSFLQKIVEIHLAMMQGNNDMVIRDRSASSKPWYWVITYHGQKFSTRPTDRVYLLGNPVVFWLNLALLAVFIIAFCTYALTNDEHSERDPVTMKYHQHKFAACWWTILAWFLHYAPFWFMDRILYVHHYFPAFIYNCMLSGIVMDYAITRASLLLPHTYAQTVLHTFSGLILSGLAYSFYLFHPLAYGMSGPNAANETSQMYGLRWLQSWNF